jgi:hypothetical protein
MSLKDWSQPRVLISGGAGLVLAFLASWLLVTASLASFPCQSPSSPVWIDLKNTTSSFSTAVCVGQTIGWTGAKQFTVTFHDTSCVSPASYIVDQPCPGAPAGVKCSVTTVVKQPGSFISPDLGWCDYDVGGGLKDPRVIIIGK